MRLIETPDYLFSKSGIQWLQYEVDRGALDEGAMRLISSDLALLKTHPHRKIRA